MGTLNFDPNGPHDSNDTMDPVRIFGFETNGCVGLSFFEENHQRITSRHFKTLQEFDQDVSFGGFHLNGETPLSLDGLIHGDFPKEIAG